MKKTGFCGLSFWVAVAAVFLCAGCHDSGVENGDGDAVNFLRAQKYYTVIDEIVYGPPLNDERDGQEYSTVKIKNRMWMAKNLNYEPDKGNSWCYGNSADNCAKYGRLYDWATAMGLDTSYNHKDWDGINGSIQGICPSGWHLPTKNDWQDLGSGCGEFGSPAGAELKARTGWSINGQSRGNGSDKCGFAGLPGGYREEGSGTFVSVGEVGYWWQSGEVDDGYNRWIGWFGLSANSDWEASGGGGTTTHWEQADYTDKERGNSVRCVKNTL